MAGSTPIYGFPYPQSTDLVADYPALGQELATDVETVISGLGSGLNLISATSIANSGGTATRTGGQVTFSGVTSVSLNGVFSATYDAYRVVLNVSASAGTAASIRLRAAGTDASGSNYGRFGYVGGATNANVNGTGESSWVTYSDLPGFLTIDLYGPFLSTVTRGFMNALESNDTRGLMQGLTHSLTTSYDGLTITRTGGTATTGTIRVYGYKNS